MSIHLPQHVEESAEYAELIHVLTTPGPGGAVVIGGVGIGKTKLVQAALARPNVPLPVMSLYCSPTLRELPYGALSPYLSSLDRAEDPIQVLREVQMLMSGAVTDRTTPIVVVEDAQFLDPESSFVLSMLVENAAIKLIAIGAGRIEGEPTLFSLTETGMLATIVVQPLGLDGVREYCEQLIGRPLTEGSLEVIRSMTGGNPSFIRVFVESALAEGLLASDLDLILSDHEDNHPCALAGLAPEPDDLLIELVHDMHSFLPIGQQRTLEVLALGGPQPSTLIAACEGSEYRHLLESKVLRVHDDGTIALRAEVHGVALRQVIAPGRSSELYGRWNEQREKLGLPKTPIQVLWSLEASAEVSDERALEAIQQANRVLDHQVAWKICALTGISTTSELGALAEASTLLGLGRLYSARAVLTALTEKTDEPAILLEAFKLLVRTMSLLGSDEGEVRRLDALWQERAGISRNRDAFREADAEYRRVKVVLELWSSLNGTNPTAFSIRGLQQILSNRQNPPEGRILALVLLSDSYSLRGMTETALEFARQAMSEIEQTAQLSNEFQLVVTFRLAWNLVFSGRYAEAEERLNSLRGYSVRQLAHQQGTLTFLRAICQLVQGKTARSMTTLVEAVAELRLRDPLQMASLARTLYGHMLNGWLPAEGERQRNKVSDTENGARRGPTVDEEVANDNVYRALRAGRRSLSMKDLACMPLIQREIIALSAERLTAEPGQAATLSRRLFNLSSEMEGSRAEFLMRLSSPAVRGDIAALRGLAARAKESLEFGVAAEALARASRQLAAAGDTRQCGSVLRELMSLVHETQITPNQYVAAALATAELTHREEEIVELAKSGKNNAAIARALTVSQRTVEGHLYRVFSKLGISDRSELLDLRTPPGTKLHQNAWR